jgi:hypothetical protein
MYALLTVTLVRHKGELKLRVFENGVVKGISDCKKEEVFSDK